MSFDTPELKNRSYNWFTSQNPKLNQFHNVFCSQPYPRPQNFMIPVGTMKLLGLLYGCQETINNKITANYF